MKNSVVDYFNVRGRQSSVAVDVGYWVGVWEHFEHIKLTSCSKLLVLGMYCIKNHVPWSLRLDELVQLEVIKCNFLKTDDVSFQIVQVLF